MTAILFRPQCVHDLAPNRQQTITWIKDDGLIHHGKTMCQGPGSQMRIPRAKLGSIIRLMNNNCLFGPVRIDSRSEYIEVNSSPPGQNGRHLAEDNFRCIFLNENYRIPSQISLKFVPRSPIDNKPTLVQVMACRQTGDKSLPELMLTRFAYAYMRY